MTAASAWLLAAAVAGAGCGQKGSLVLAEPAPGSARAASSPAVRGTALPASSASPTALPASAAR